MLNFLVFQSFNPNRNFAFRYSVVGVLEDLATSFRVLEAMLPRSSLRKQKAGVGGRIGAVGWK